jgi:hypothetical protein
MEAQFLTGMISNSACWFDFCLHMAASLVSSLAILSEPLPDDLEHLRTAALLTRRAKKRKLSHTPNDFPSASSHDDSRDTIPASHPASVSPTASDQFQEDKEEGELSDEDQQPAEPSMEATSHQQQSRMFFFG